MDSQGTSTMISAGVYFAVKFAKQWTIVCLKSSKCSLKWQVLLAEERPVLTQCYSAQLYLCVLYIVRRVQED